METAIAFSIPLRLLGFNPQGKESLHLSPTLLWGALLLPRLLGVPTSKIPASGTGRHSVPLTLLIAPEDWLPMVSQLLSQKRSPMGSLVGAPDIKAEGMWLLQKTHKI